MNNRRSATGKVQYIVLTWVPDELLDEWNEWHNTTHIPDVLSTPQMRGARKFRVRDMSYPGEWQPQYATVYELDSQADMDAYLAGPAVALREDYARHYGAVGKIARLILTEEAHFGP